MPDLTSGWGRENSDLYTEPDALKWDPSQPRDAIGRFAADDGGEEAEEKPRRKRPTDTEEATAAQAGLDAADLGQGADPAKAAEAAARKKYGIPGKKKFGRLPKERRAAARKLLAAARAVARAQARATRAERRVKAIRDELQKPYGKKTKRALRERLAKATKAEEAVAVKVKAAKDALATARRAWSTH